MGGGSSSKLQLGTRSVPAETVTDSRPEALIAPAPAPRCSEGAVFTGTVVTHGGGCASGRVYVIMASHAVIAS